MLTKSNQLIVEQAAKKGGATLEHQPNKSTKSAMVFYARSTDRPTTRKHIGNHLKSKKIAVVVKKTSLSSEDITEFTIGGQMVRIVYKPMSGGMTETTLNSTITELVPCLMWLNKITEKNVDKLYEKILKLDNSKQKCYVNQSDAKSGVEFIEQFPQSSKYKEKMTNAIAIKDFLDDTNKKKSIKNVYWTYRAKPAGIPPNSPADIVIFFNDGSKLGVSLKAGGETTKEPLLNTYVNKVFYSFEPAGNEIIKLRKKLYDLTYSKIPGLDRHYDEAAWRTKTFEVLDKFEREDIKNYEKFYDKNLNHIREQLGKMFIKDVKKFIKYCRSEILKQSDVPIIIIKAFGKDYKEVKDGNRLGVLLSQVTKVTFETSPSSKQNFDLCLYNKSKKIGTMNMAVRSNKVGVQHKLGQFFNLAVKYNGLKE